MVKAITDATFEQETKDGLVLIDFWAKTQFLCQEYYGSLWLHLKSGTTSQSKPLPPLFLGGFML